MGMKAHLGCGHRFIPELIHVDLCDMPHINYKTGIDSLPFFSDKSLELIYCSHAFEYFDRDMARVILREWWRVLEPGGTLRLAVPDFQALIGIYQKTGDLARILGPLYGKISIDTEQAPYTLYHKTTYDKVSLSDILEECGFIRPHLWDWRKTEHANIDDHSQAYFPHMQKDTGILVSLNIQAYKPK